jgi:CheY-like chemotaxis protein
LIRTSAHRVIERPIETVLFVNEEPGDRQEAKRGLTRRGYRVHVAVGGPRALDIYPWHPGHFDIVVSNVAIPRIGVSGAPGSDGGLA